MKKYIFLLVLMMSSYANAEPSFSDRPWAIGTSFGTLGFGLDLSTPVLEDLNTRLSLTMPLELSHNFNEEGIDYDATVKSRALGVMVDYYVGNSAFFVSGGLYLNQTDVDFKASGQDEYDIGGKTYQGDLTVDGSVAFKNSIAPYIGIGFGNPHSRDKGWGFQGTFGVMYTGGLEVDTFDTRGIADDLSTPGNDNIDVSTDSTFQKEKEKEISNLNDDLSDYSLYPVLMLTVTYRF